MKEDNNSMSVLIFISLSIFITAVLICYTILTVPKTDNLKKMNDALDRYEEKYGLDE